MNPGRVESVTKTNSRGEVADDGTHTRVTVELSAGGVADFLLRHGDARLLAARLEALASDDGSIRARHRSLAARLRQLDAARDLLVAPIEAEAASLKRELASIYAEIGEPAKECNACNIGIFKGDPHYYAGGPTLCQGCAPTTQQEIDSLMGMVRDGTLPDWAKCEEQLIETAAALRKYLPGEKRTKPA
jgi:hypothetical protein